MAHMMPFMGPINLPFSRCLARTAGYTGFVGWDQRGNVTLDVFCSRSGGRFPNCGSY